MHHRDPPILPEGLIVSHYEDKGSRSITAGLEFEGKNTLKNQGADPGGAFRGLERFANLQHRGRRTRGLIVTGASPTRYDQLSEAS